MELSNENLSKQFFELHNLVAAHPDEPNDKFRAATYFHVGKIIKDYPTPVWQNTSELLMIKGVGPSSIQKIEEAANAEDHTIPRLKELRMKYGNVEYKMKSMFCVLNLNKAKNVVLKPTPKGFNLFAKVPKDMLERVKNMTAGVCVKGPEINSWFRDDIYFTLTIGIY